MQLRLSLLTLTSTNVRFVCKLQNAIPLPPTHDAVGWGNNHQSLPPHLPPLSGLPLPALNVLLRPQYLSASKTLFSPPPFQASLFRL